MHHLTLRVLLASVLALLAMLAAPGTAQAHTERVDASPAAGTVVSTSVDRIRVGFADTLVPDLARLAVLDGDGGDHATGPVTVLGGNAEVAVRDLAAGPYRVRYRVVGGDGHAVEGTYRFRVARGPAAVGSAAPPTAPLAAGPTSPSSSRWAFPAAALGCLVVIVAARVRVARTARREARA